MDVFLATFRFFQESRNYVLYSTWTLEGDPLCKPCQVPVTPELEFPSLPFLPSASS